MLSQVRGLPQGFPVMASLNLTDGPCAWCINSKLHNKHHQSHAVMTVQGTQFWGNYSWTLSTPTLNCTSFKAQKKKNYLENHVNAEFLHRTLIMTNFHCISWWSVLASVHWSDTSLDSEGDQWVNVMPSVNVCHQLIMRVLFGSYQSFAPLLDFGLWGKHGNHSLGFS